MTARRWLLAGQDLLREGGLPAVKQAELVARTGLTTGSFYHHFGSMAAYLEALAGFYGEDRAHELLAQIDMGEPNETAE
ncbi:MAG: TetR/AcrR family transcriptional regulator, partial [Acidimicrobiales bacterium]